MGSFFIHLRRKILGQILDDLVSLLLGDVGIFLQHFQYFILPLRPGGTLCHHSFQGVAGSANSFHQFFPGSFGQSRRCLPRGRYRKEYKSDGF